MRNVLQQYADEAEKLTKGEKISTFGDNVMVACEYIAIMAMAAALFLAFTGWAIGLA